MSYKVEVIADTSGNWCSNSCRFATSEEAHAYSRDLYSRWMAVSKTRVADSEDPVNYKFTETGLHPLEDVS